LGPVEHVLAQFRIRIGSGGVLSPLAAADVGDGEQLFTFDTGSSGTFLSAQLYRRHMPAFAAARKMQLRLAGGSRIIPPTTFPD